MKIYQYFYLAIAVTVLASCTLQEVEQQPQTDTDKKTGTHLLVNVPSQIAMGQTIYVPVYSHIYYMNQQRAYYLAATLSIRNTDPTKPIIITSVNYYDTDGKLVQQYLSRPLQLDPLASTDFFVEQKDPRGGVGANFLVEWIAEEIVSEPLVEAVMIGTAGTQGISFVTPGKVIKSKSSTLNR
ncbi:MAG: DUF3124 domain-containing protein [Xenococcaceae cyanobacterium]